MLLLKKYMWRLLGSFGIGRADGRANEEPALLKRPRTRVHGLQPYGQTKCATLPTARSKNFDGNGQVSPTRRSEFRALPANNVWAWALRKTRTTTMRSSTQGRVEQSTSKCLRPRCWAHISRLRSTGATCSMKCSSMSSSCTSRSDNTSVIPSEFDF